MRRFSFLLLFVLGVPHAWAHECTVRPVALELRFYPGELRAFINSDADCWVDEVLNVPFSSPLPASGWPESMQKKARAYVEKSFAVKLDSQTLTADSMDCRFIQEPLTKTSRVVFDLHYLLPAFGKELSGRAQFFSDIFATEKNSGHLDDLKNFYTTLQVSGRRSLQIQIPVEKPDFSFPIDGLQRTAAQNNWEKLTNALYRLFSSFVFWIFVIMVGVKIHARYFKRSEG